MGLTGQGTAMKRDPPLDASRQTLAVISDFSSVILCAGRQWSHRSLRRESGFSETTYSFKLSLLGKDTDQNK